MNASVSDLPGNISSILPLAAEVGFSKSEQKPVVQWITLNGKTLSSFPTPKHLVIRIGSSAAQTTWNIDSCEAIGQVCRNLVARSAREKWEISGIQIDYDCPASRLGDYAKLLRFLRILPELKSLELSFTALPSWLDTSKNGFQQLNDSVDYFVLQVHALQLPKSANDSVVIIDPQQARRAVERAGKLKFPFYVALPTYSSFIVYDEKNGKVTDVISEDLGTGQLSSSQKMMLGESSPKQMAQLVREWTDSPPSLSMKGIIWYRLPVSTDLLNWPTETWKIVMSGTAPKSRVEIFVESQEEGFARISVLNSGQQPESNLPEIITLTAPPQNSIASGDGGRWYRISSNRNAKTKSLSFELIPTKNDLAPLPVGRSVPVGWIRLKSGGGYDEINIETSLSRKPVSD